MTDERKEKELSVGQLLGGMCLSMKIGEGLRICESFTLLIEQSFKGRDAVQLRIIADRDKWPVKRLGREQVELLIEESRKNHQ